jgi:adenylate cyclase
LRGRTWEAYQRGLWHRAKIESAENQVARGFFQRAIDLDPTFAPPYHALAQTYFDDAHLFFKRTLAEAADLAEPPAYRALALDPNDADAHAGIALVAAARGDLATELTRAEQALSLDPNCAVAYRVKGACLICSPVTRVEGCQTLLRSLRLNPNDPRNWWIWNNLAVGRYLLEDYMGAVDAAQQEIRTRPGGIPVYRWLIAALGQLGRTDDAQAVLRQATVALAPMSFDDYARRRLPWLSEEDHQHMLDGLHLAGWRPTPARAD